MNTTLKLLLLTLLSLSIIGCSDDFFDKNHPEQQIVPPTTVTQISTTSSKKVLILYDTAGNFGNSGKINAMFLQNLLGHFNTNITSKPAVEYRKDEMENYSVVFYIGTTYNVLSFYNIGSNEQSSYENFYRDIATKDKTVVWINYNLALLEQFWNDNNLADTTFSKAMGMTFKYVAQGKYNRVTYKDTELFKGVIPFKLPGDNNSVCEYEGSNRYACSLELNLIDITNIDKTKIYATSYSTLPDTNTPVSPYITKGDNFWFVGDIPFAYMSEEDRYLAFSDLLHDMLRIDHEESHKALMRLEDVDAKTKLSNLTLISDFMRKENIPYAISTITRYEDPLGIEHNGVATTIKLSNSVIANKLKALYNEGLISLVQHGTTHQFHNSINDRPFEINNPYNGLTGFDFEFMRVVKQADNALSYLYPIKNDSGTWAKERILEGKDILSEMGLTAFAWEAPHYMAGPNHYRAIAEIYPVQYARVLYFPNEESKDINVRNTFVGQFFPYVIKKDLYGSTVIPENIHNIVHNPNEDYREILPADSINFAKKLKVVRDGVASFYYHPFLGTNDLEEVIHGLEDIGYEFVSAPSLVK
ncbi:DUF2334 domain-containing protein [bacterium]|nr:DUF2334 domain-containing protein [bacterium]MBU1957964.1 DUF2334 domain-containing protein [bacterium]